MSEHRPQKTSKGNLIGLIISCLLVLATGIWQMNQLGHMADRYEREASLMQAAAIAQTITPEQIESLSFTASDLENPVFQRLSAQLAAAAEHLKIAGLFTIAQRDGSFVFGPGSYPEGHPAAAHPGAPYRLPPPQVEEAFASRQPQTTGFYKDEYGAAVSTLMPILEPRTGNVLMLVGADLDLKRWQQQILYARGMPLFFTVLVLVLLAAGFWAIYRRARLSPSSRWAHRYAEAFLCAGVMLTLTTAAVWRIRFGEHHAHNASFVALAQQQASAITRELDLIQKQLETLSLLFSGSREVSRHEFDLDVSRFFSDSAIRHALWLPTVRSNEVARFEAEARASGRASYEVWQFGEEGERRPAGGRPLLHPILYLEPHDGTGQTAEGYDIGAGPLCGAAIEETSRSGLIAATDPVPFFCMTNHPAGIVVFHTASSGTQTGLVAIAVDLNSLVTVPMNRGSRSGCGLIADLFRLKAGQPPLFLSSSAPAHTTTSDNRWNDHAAGPPFITPFFCFGKTYAIVVHASPAWLSAAPPKDSVTAAVVGLLLTALLTSLFLFLSNRQITLERAVANRTADLRVAHDNLKGLLSATPVAMLVVDRQARVLAVNPRAEHLFLTKAAECAGQDCGFFLRCANRHGSPAGCGHGPLCAECPLRRAIQKVSEGEPSIYDRDMETRVDRDGKTETRHIRFSVAPVVFESQPRIVVTLYDITPSYRVEQIYRTLFLEMDYGIALYEQVTDGKGHITDFRFTTVNPAYERITGLSEEILSDKTLLATRPAFPAELFATFVKVAEGGPASRYSFHDKSCNRHYEGTLFRFESGQLANIFTDVTDRILAEERVSRAAEETLVLLKETEAARSDLLSAVEEQKRADEALVNERNLLYALMDNLPDLIFFKDTESRFLKISKAHAVSLGLVSPEAAVGKSDADFRSVGEAERTRAQEQEIIMTGLPLLAQVEQKRTADGKARWVSASKAPIKDSEGHVVGIVGISRDITHEIELQQELQQASKMDAIGRLAGGVAHDFNNLLQAIMGFTEILLAGVTDKDVQYGDLKQIERAAKRAADLTRQLLAFSRKQRVEPRLLDLNQVIVATEKMLRRLMGENIEIALLLAPDAKPVKADPNQIEQVLMNLAVNAKDAMPKGGRLTFSTATVVLQSADITMFPESFPGTFTCLSVCDTGIGLSQEMLPHLFEPFFTTKAQGKGTGLGLSVIYGIVKQNGGWINVYSEAGQGTTFKIYLPARDEPAEPLEPDTRTKAAISLPGIGKTILLVEDEPGVRSLAALVLQGAGYHVFARENAQDAKDLLARANTRIDLLFSDVVLTGQNGIDLALDLRAKHPDLAVLLCSGYADDSVRWKSIRQKGFHFLPKPYPTEKLLTAVQEALNVQP